jgi:hypothetical protein
MTRGRMLTLLNSTQNAFWAMTEKIQSLNLARSALVSVDGEHGDDFKCNANFLLQYLPRYAQIILNKQNFDVFRFHGQVFTSLMPPSGYPPQCHSRCLIFPRSSRMVLRSPQKLTLHPGRSGMSCTLSHPRCYFIQTYSQPPQAIQVLYQASFSKSHCAHSAGC